METIKIGLEMLKFSISNCYVMFGEDYFQYGKEMDPLLRVLAIGSFDAAWLANMVECYILDMTKNRWKKLFSYFKIYRDDGFGVAKNSSVEELIRGFKKFQKCVDKVTDGDI